MKDISNTCIYLYLRIPARSPFPTHKWHRGATNPPGSPIRVASWSDQVPRASPTNLVYNNPFEAQADPAVGRQESEISAVGLSAQRGSTSVHVLMHRFLCLIIAPLVSQTSAEA